MYIVVPLEPKSQRKRNLKRDFVCTDCLTKRDLANLPLNEIETLKKYQKQRGKAENPIH